MYACLHVLYRVCKHVGRHGAGTWGSRFVQIGGGGGGGGQVGTYICYSTVVRAYVPQHASTFVATGRLGIVR